MNNWQIVIGVVLLAHAIGHVLGILPALGVGRSVPGWNMRSWLLGDRIGERAATALAVVLWAGLIGAFVFVAGGVAELGVPADAWRPVAVVASALSLLTLGVFWNGFPSFFPNKLGAIVVNVAILVFLLIEDRPQDDLLGR